MPHVTSHRCGIGRYARDAWGSREGCDRCSAEDARMEKVRKHYAEQARQSAEYVEKKHPFAGTTMNFHSECLTANEESNNEEVQF